MSPFSKFPNAAQKAGSFLRRALASLNRGWSIPPERIELATRIKNIEPQPTPFLERIELALKNPPKLLLEPHEPLTEMPDPQWVQEARNFTPEELLCDPYPAELARSTAPLCDGPPAKAHKARNVLGSFTAGEHHKWLDACNFLVELGYYWNGHQWRVNKTSKAGEEIRKQLSAVRTLISYGFVYRGGVFWSQHTDDGFFLRVHRDRLADGPLPELVPMTLDQKERAHGAVRLLRTLGWRWERTGDHGRWDKPEPLPEPAPGVADNLRDAIAFALDDHNPDGLEWLRAWNDGDEGADQELCQWREHRQPKHSPEPVWTRDFRQAEHPCGAYSRKAGKCVLPEKVSNRARCAKCPERRP
jgi:hypothetical protein